MASLAPIPSSGMECGSTERACAISSAAAVVGNVRNEALVLRIVEKTELSTSEWNVEFEGSILALGGRGKVRVADRWRRTMERLMRTGRLNPHHLKVNVNNKNGRLTCTSWGRSHIPYA